jgi:hypothetical protein
VRWLQEKRDEDARRETVSRGRARRERHILG